MTSETNTQARHTTPALPAIPRRVLIAALLRAFLSVLVVVTIYFLIPLDHLSGTRSVVEFVLGVLLVVIVLAIQLRGIVRSPYPLVRTVEALATTGPLFVIVFATTQSAIGSAQPGSYSEPMTRLDALYFTVTTFATVGYGDIAPVSQAARLVALLHGARPHPVGHRRPRDHRSREVGDGATPKRPAGRGGIIPSGRCRPGPNHRTVGRTELVAKESARNVTGTGTCTIDTGRRRPNAAGTSVDSHDDARGMT
jgi:hypothetical protein